jgi:DNA processing protein
MERADIIYKLALKNIPNIGPIQAKNLVSYCGGVKEVFSAQERLLKTIPGIGPKRTADIINFNDFSQAEAEYELIQKNNIKITFYLDDDYPSRLKHYPDSPIVLYSSGNVNYEAYRTVGIVGTRKPSPYGITQCEKIVEELKAYNVTIISGLAYGIDTTAHRKSVEIDMPTIGILGNGLSKLYPATNRQLAQKMKSKGGLVSEFSMNTIPDRENFPQRNRIISALSDVTIVVESAIKGGSMITAIFANEQNKDVFAIPGKNTDTMSAGCNHLIKTNQAHLLSSVKDIAYIMRWEEKEQPKQMELMLELSDDEKLIIEKLRKEDLGPDSLVYHTGLKLSEISSILLNLEFKGIVKSLPGKKYILA